MSALPEATETGCEVGQQGLCTAMAISRLVCRYVQTNTGVPEWMSREGAPGSRIVGL